MCRVESVSLKLFIYTLSIITLFATSNQFAVVDLLWQTQCHWPQFTPKYQQLTASFEWIPAVQTAG